MTALFIILGITLYVVYSIVIVAVSEWMTARTWWLAVLELPAYPLAWLTRGLAAAIIWAFRLPE